MQLYYFTLIIFPITSTHHDQLNWRCNFLLQILPQLYFCIYLQVCTIHIAITIYKQTHLQYTRYDYVVYYIFLHALLHNCE